MALCWHPSGASPASSHALSDPNQPPTLCSSLSSPCTVRSSIDLLSTIRPSVCWTTSIVMLSTRTKSRASGPHSSGFEEEISPLTSHPCSAKKTAPSGGIVLEGSLSTLTEKGRTVSKEPDLMKILLPFNRCPETETSCRKAGAHKSPQYLSTLPRNSKRGSSPAKCRGICKKLLQPVLHKSKVSPTTFWI